MTSDQQQGPKAQSLASIQWFAPRVAELEGVYCESSSLLCAAYCLFLRGTASAYHHAALCNLFADGLAALDGAQAQQAWL